jgi:2-methylcitrate dehydratase PrpD
MEVTEKLAEFIHDTTFQDIPEDVVASSRECFMDWHGVALAGTREESARIILEYVKEVGGKPEASVLGSNFKTNAADAALANGIIGHALDFDDYHDDTVIHATAVCLPAILAVAENINSSGEDVLTALILGIDVCIRIGLGLGDYHYQRGWHTTSTAGIFGATAGAAKILKLETDKIITALGICGTQASGLRQVFGTMSKPFHAGKVSMEGVLSTLLAQKGFTSAQKIVEGELGLLEVLTETPNEEIIMDQLGSKYYIQDLSFKPYPT